MLDALFAGGIAECASLSSPTWTCFPCVDCQVTLWQRIQDNEKGMLTLGSFSITVHKS